MKKHFIILAALLLFASVGLFANRSGLSIRLFDNSEIEVHFNNQKFYNSNRYTISNIHSGNHHLRVYQIRQNRNGRIHRTLFFSRSIFIPNSTFVEALIDRNRNLIVLSERPSGNYGHNNGTHYGNNHGNNYGGNYGNYNRPMGDYEFSMLKSTLASQSFDSRKLSLAKSALSHNQIVSRQALELVELMNFESNKLSLAKFAYESTIDKGNYFMVNNAFSFSSSIDELNRYIYGR
ncbi:MAG: DUF4476 domain-containing protein [Bacteroidales bacterium]|nr:DUF4476 domain-containing protein [Bacteroidales bacterium]